MSPAPMRPLYAIGAATVILGVVAAYMKFQASVSRPPPRVIERTAEGDFDLELTLTFDAAPDPFSLDGEAIHVAFRGRTLLSQKKPVAAGEPLLVEHVEGIVLPSAGREGRNEFFLRVSPAQASEAGDAFALNSPPAETAEPAKAVARAVRVRLLRDGVAVADETLWSAPGEPVEGVIAVTLAPDSVNNAPARGAGETDGDH